MRITRTRALGGAFCAGALLLGPITASPASARQVDDPPPAENSAPESSAPETPSGANLPALGPSGTEQPSEDPARNTVLIEGTEPVVGPAGEITAPVTDILRPAVDANADPKPAQTSTPESSDPQQPQGGPGDSGSGDSGSGDSGSGDSGSSDSGSGENGSGEIGEQPQGPTPAGGVPDQEQQSCSADEIGCQADDADDEKVEKKSDTKRTKTTEPRSGPAPASGNGVVNPQLPKTGGAATDVLPVGIAMVVLGVFVAGRGRHRRPSEV